MCTILGNFFLIPFLPKYILNFLPFALGVNSHWFGLKLYIHDCSLLLLWCPQSSSVPYSGKVSRITNKHARENVSRFLFSPQVTMSDHTPYNFPHGNGDLSVYFKACQSLSAKTAMPRGGS